MCTYYYSQRILFVVLEASMYIILIYGHCFHPSYGRKKQCFIIDLRSLTLDAAWRWFGIPSFGEWSF